MKILNKKGQTWSFDLLIAVVLFIVVVSIFYALLSSNTESDSTTDLQTEAKSVSHYFNCDVSDYQYCFVVAGKIKEDKLNDLMQYIEINPESAYASIKKDLGVTGDFCIYFRDSTGYLVPIDYNNASYSGIGETTFMLNEDIACGTVIEANQWGE